MASVGFFVDCSHTTLFVSTYARGNENGGVKRLQDFPHECHVTKALSVKVELASPMRSSHLAVFAQFELADDPSALSLGQHLRIDELDADVRSRQDPLRAWIKGRADDTTGEPSSVQVFHLNEGNQAGWHYSWKSGRGQAVRETKHCLRAYVMACVDAQVCRVLLVASTPAFTIESSRRKAEPLGPDVLVTFSKLFAPESSIRVKAMQLQTLYDFLSSLVLPHLVFVQPQIQKQLHELIYKPPRAASKRKRAITGDASVFAALWRASAPAAVAPTAKARVEVGVNLLYDIVRHLPFMHKLIFQRDGPWRLGATPELYNCWVENTARAMDALLAKPGLTLAGFCAKLDTPLSEPVSLDQFLRLLPTLHPTDYVDPPSLPHQGAFTASWTLDPARLELRTVGALPSLSLITVLRTISMLSGFSLSLVQSTLHMRSYAEWLPTAWTTYVLDGRLHPCDAVLPNGEPMSMIALDRYVGWHKDTKLRVDLFGPSLRLSVRCALTKETEMDMDVIVWATPSGDDGTADLPDDVLDARCGRLLHATGGFAAEG